ncbi:response regulator [Aquimarina longa]|uniref:response regulator n=1 Tax=Aquimarina longa TaxID=1080221 RepID=UPI0007805043|nr:response regulator [Aquimarina longa]
MVYYIIGGILIAILIWLWLKYTELKKKLYNKKKKLKSIQQEANKQFKLQQDLICIINKEIRTPLYGIMGLISLLTEEHPELKNDKNLKSIQFSGEYIFNLINNVLHVNFLEFKEVTSQNVSFNLKEVTENLVHSFSYATENSNNVLHFDFDSKINQLINGDPDILSQILMNLLSNALRFTKNGSVYFSVNLIDKQEDSCTISFTIKHDGYRTSKEEQNSIYQEFINVKNAKQSYLDTDINSKIVNRFVHAINGKITIKNDNGSEYALVIDFKTPNVDKRITTSNPHKSRLKALIVDDNKLNLLVTEKILSKKQFDCTTIDNGFDAIKLVKENGYDVILMDINMPKLNGIGTTKRIREFNTETPIIALTAVDITQLNRQITQAGLNDYIIKPYNKNHLLELIYKHINNSNK